MGSGPVTGDTAPAGPDDGVVVDRDVPGEATIFGWIEEVFAHGIRRPGYPADRWAERFCAEHFTRLGMEAVRLEPVEVTRWEPRRWSLEVWRDGHPPEELACYPVSYAAPTEPVELELAAYRQTDPTRVAGKAALYDLTLLQVPAVMFAYTGDAPASVTDRILDPSGTLAQEAQRLPIPPEMQGAMGPSIAAGARAFVGSFTNLPGDSYQFFLPATEEPRPIPGVWIGRRDAARLHAWLAEGPVRIRLAVESTSERVRSFNVVGELPGADDQVVMVNSHHDGPWASAVEDGSGIALVLAQASYWAAQPPERRPHRLVFLLQAGHMEAGAGMAAYIEAHRAELDDVVLQVTLEHAARDCVEGDDGDGHGDGDGEDAGRVVVTDRPVPRWFFTSRIPHLERAVVDAVRREGLDRSLLLAPNAIGPHPQSDGGYYYYEGVPLMHYITAPWYLFDAQDTLDKIDRPSLVPVTRATIRVVASTAGISAAEMRSADLRNG